MPFFDTTDGARLFYAEAGAPDAPTVVFAHPWGLNSGMWNYQTPAILEAGLRCVVFDRRGHGRSDLPPRGYDIDRLADDVADLFTHLDLRDAVLVGHSLGAAEVVRHLARCGDERVRGIVLSAPVTPFPLRTDDNPEGYVSAADVEESRKNMRRDIGLFVGATSDADYFGPGHAVSTGLSDWTRRQIVDTHLQVLLATMKTSLTTDQRDELAKITVPALVLQGDADRSTPIDKTGRRTHALLPDSRLVVIDGAGHGLYVSDPDGYNAALLGFVGELVD